jgi:RNA polymerase sigma-70 factor (ECF subfamily)
MKLIEPGIPSMSSSEDAVRRFLAGEDSAFGQLVRLWEKRIYNLAWRFLGNREDAQDAVQDTFLAAYKSLRTLRDPESFPTWIYQIALNHCRGRWRSRSRHARLAGQTGEGQEDAGDGVRSEDAAAVPRDPVETVDLIRKALSNLSEEHRTAILLKEYLGLSLEEVAEVMECPLSTAKSRLYHGLRGVQRNLKRLGVKY